MKRSALIIGSSLPTYHTDHLRGVGEDILNYKKFLLSANGGAWTEDEIIELEDPSISEIRQAKRYQDGSHFALSLFSGHGFMRDGKNFLVVNGNTYINYTYLFSKASKSMVIMDACRNDYPYEHFEGISGLGLQFDERFQNLARKIYDLIVSKAPNGKVAIFSTAENESSIDTSDGGAFTVELFSQTISWINNNTHSYLFLGDAFKKIRAGLQTYTYPQIPQVKYTSKEMLVLPLATNPKVLVQRNFNQVNNTLSRNQKRSKGFDIYILT